VGKSGTRASAAEVLVHLDRSAPVPLRTQLEQVLRDQIRSGILQAGATLPSTRILAADLGISRRLVVEAYQQLSAEGYLTTTERSTTRVGKICGVEARPAQLHDPPVARYDLRPGMPGLSGFPRAAWLKSITTAIKSAPSDAFAYPDPQGSNVLRNALAEYLRRVRAVVAEPDRIVICAGFTQALSLLTQVLHGQAIALEDPGVIGRSQTILAAGGKYVGIPVDDMGLRSDLLPGIEAAAVVVAPAHHFPLGVTLSASRRSQLLSWALRDRLIIEDDYDAEFRYDRQPVGAVQGLEPEQVAYVGTVSKTLAPAMRLGWLVLPRSLVGPIIEAKRSHDAGSPTLDQLALADMIDGGAYERHLRRVRRVYRQRRDHLVTALREYLPAARIGGIAAGLHLVVRLPVDRDSTEIVAAAAENDLAIAGLHRYMLTDMVDSQCRVLVGYANATPDAMDTAIRKLAKIVAAFGR
jgi:GntR family transcriptional regulator/MocR family aminotransferase